MLCINPIINTSQYQGTVNKRSVSFRGLPKDVLQLSTSSKTSGAGSFFNKVKKFLNIGKTVITPDMLKKYQSDFQSLFLREDISLKETKNIINRYKSIEKIGDKFEYANAFYQETKRNFGFGNIDLPLRFAKGTKYEAGTSVGGAKSLMHEVLISPELAKNKMHKVIFHELRHIKQNYYSANLDFGTYLKTIFDRLRPSLPKGATEADMQIAIYLTADKMVKRWGRFTPENIPPKDMEYAKKCLESRKNYVSPKDDMEGYLNSFVEQDAYGSEFEFEKLYSKLKNSKLEA